MTTPTALEQRPALRLTPSTIGLLTVAALAWGGVLAYEHDMGNGRGSMGMPLPEFLPMWAVMMAAMMLPAVAPVATLYGRTIAARRGLRLPVFVTGYVIAWTAAGIPTYMLLRLVDHTAGDNDTAMRTIAVATLAIAGVYQLSPLKAVCLRHCRSPLAQLLHYGNVKGPLRDIKVSLHHASYCLGCCWALMVLFLAFGIMNVWAMLGLAAIVVTEKVHRRGEAIGRVAGLAFLALAILVLASPAVADTIVPDGGPNGTMTQM